MKPDDISYNFSVTKVMCILMVATAHYFGGLLWIPTTVALFVFAFSSGYFSASKYHGDFSISRFWKAKLIRLGYSLVVTNCFLLLLFLIQAKSKIFSWDTLLSMVGLNAILSWFGIHNHSPFGNGLWFLAVLWMFYILYPVIERTNRNPKVAFIFILCMLGITTYLNFTVLVGYELWITIFGFLFGTYIATIKSRLPFIYASGILIASITTMLALNKYWGIHSLNYYFILVSAVAICHILLTRRLPDIIGPISSILAGSVLEIYLIHTYLFIKTPNYPFLGYVVSMLLIILVAMFLSATRDRLKTTIDKNRYCAVKN
ncbi:acyltransferase family protein [Ferrovum myxofaciens]|uniref:acyltransferase family protein n=1 Tax=Ferrovum myxofaciens TaxID=416213 RepID=UPI0004E225EE|nr:acyltransferase family protein [Ferrovum myxofaciens]